MVFQGRLRFADEGGAERAAERLEQVKVLAGHVGREGPALKIDALTVADAAEYPDVIAILDEVADEAIGGSVTARLGGQPSDWVGAGAPLPALDSLSPQAQDLLRACIGCDADAIEEARDEVVESETLLGELLAGAGVLEDDEQLAHFVLLVGDRRDRELEQDRALEPVMRKALDLPLGEDLYDLARHVAVSWYAGTEDPGFEFTDREAVALEIARIKGSR